MAQKIMEVGLLLFNTYIPPENTEKDNYTPIKSKATVAIKVTVKVTSKVTIKVK